MKKCKEQGQGGLEQFYVTQQGAVPSSPPPTPRLGEDESVSHSKPTCESAFVLSLQGDAEAC